MIWCILQLVFTSYLSIHYLMVFWRSTFWHYIFWSTVVRLCQWRQCTGFLYYVVFLEESTLFWFFSAALHVRGVDVNWVHLSIIWVPMVFFEIICKIFFSFLPKYAEINFFDAVSIILCWFLYMVIYYSFY